MLDHPRQPPHCKSHNSLPRHQSCSRDVGGRLREADGWQPKSFPTASGRGNQPAGGDPESNRGCPGPLTSRVCGAAQRRFLKISDQETVSRRESDSVNIAIEEN